MLNALAFHYLLGGLMPSFDDLNQTRTVRGSDHSPAVELSEQKDKLITENWRD